MAPRSAPARGFARSSRPAPPPSRAKGSSRPPRPPRPPPPQTRPEDVEALARKARVSPRIARRELEGELRCEDWRLQNPDEAARYDRIYALLDAFPHLSLDAAAGHEASGTTVESMRAARAETDANARITESRKAVSGAAVDAFRQQLIDEGVELSVAFADRAVVDRLVKVERLALVFADAGAVPSLDVVVLAPTSTWAALRTVATYDEALLASPLAVASVPSRRPAADPQPFFELVGRRVSITLRHGIVLELVLAAVGPYDLLFESGGGRLLVPLHALAAWHAVASDGAVSRTSRRAPRRRPSSAG